MSTAAEKLLADFDTLPALERDAVLAELLLRNPAGEGHLSDETLVGLADDLFRRYDAEEADAPSPR